MAWNESVIGGLSAADVVAWLVIGRPHMECVWARRACGCRRPCHDSRPRPDRSEDGASVPGHPPHPPQRGRVGQWIAVDQGEVRRAAFADGPRVCLGEELATTPRRGAKGLPRLEPGFDEALHLPGQLV